MRHLTFDEACDLVQTPRGQVQPAVLEHLLTCGPCSELVNRAEQLENAMHSAFLLPPAVHERADDDRLWAAIQNGIASPVVADQTPRRRATMGWRYRAWTSSLAGVAAVALIAVGWFGHRLVPSRSTPTTNQFAMLAAPNSVSRAAGTAMTQTHSAPVTEGKMQAGVKLNASTPSASVMASSGASVTTDVAGSYTGVVQVDVSTVQAGKSAPVGNADVTILGASGSTITGVTHADGKTPIWKVTASNPYFTDWPNWSTLGGPVSHGFVTVLVHCNGYVPSVVRDVPVGEAGSSPMQVKVQLRASKTTSSKPTVFTWPLSASDAQDIAKYLHNASVQKP